MSWETGWNSDTLRGRNLKTQFYLYGLAHRPHALIALENGAFRNHFSDRKNLRTQLYFYDISLPFLLIRHKNENFENVLQTRGIWKCLLFVLCEQKTFWKPSFFENDEVIIIIIFPCPSFTQTDPKWPVIVAFFKFLRRGVDGKHLMSFSECVLRFPWYLPA